MFAIFTSALCMLLVQVDSSVVCIGLFTVSRWWKERKALFLNDDTFLISNNLNILTLFITLLIMPCPVSNQLILLPNQNFYHDTMNIFNRGHRARIINRILILYATKYCVSCFCQHFIIKKKTKSTSDSENERNFDNMKTAEWKHSVKKEEDCL